MKGDAYPHILDEESREMNFLPIAPNRRSLERP